MADLEEVRHALAGDSTHDSRHDVLADNLASTKGVSVRGVLERAFRTYGLPRAIRMDNGVPFATGGIHGLSQLNVWWIRLGIQHQRIRPASPQQNAAHERMHKTLKAGALRPPKASAVAQQRAFNTFRREYNEERPHEFLAGATPATATNPLRETVRRGTRPSSIRRTSSSSA